jgi:hypothetical protein
MKYNMPELPIDPTREYKPSEIAQSGWIVNTKGKKDYLYILHLINAGKLRARDVAIGQTKYFKVLGADILKWKQSSYNLPAQTEHESAGDTITNQPSENILPQDR